MIIWLFHLEYIIIINLYAPSNRTSKYNEAKSMQWKRETDSSTIIVGYFNILLSIAEQTENQQETKKLEQHYQSTRPNSHL